VIEHYSNLLAKSVIACISKPDTIVNETDKVIAHIHTISYMNYIVYYALTYALTDDYFIDILEEVI
jgi:hypothetical protein